jgi:putative transposase
MCRVLQVSASAFYAWQNRPPSQRQQNDEVLSQQIEAVFRASRGRYGSPRIYHELRAQGVRCSQNRVARLMRQHGWGARVPRRRVQTTDSAHTQPVAPNLLARRFSPDEIGGVNRVWAGDITYIATAQGWLYLAVVLDLKSRRVVEGAWGRRSKHLW